MRLSWRERAAVEQLWREFVIARLWSSSSGARLLEMITEPPDAFVAYELGLRAGHGPSVFEVSEWLHTDNVERMRRFQRDELKRERELRKLQPLRVARRRPSLAEWRGPRARDWVPIDPNGNSRAAERAIRIERRRQEAERSRENVKRPRSAHAEKRRPKERAVEA